MHHSDVKLTLNMQYVSETTSLLLARETNSKYISLYYVLFLHNFYVREMRKYEKGYSVHVSNKFNLPHILPLNYHTYCKPLFLLLGTT